MALQRIFRPLLKRLQRGDVVWIHNRPDFAIALTPHIRRAGGRVVLHLHNAHLVEWPTALMQQVRADRLVFVSDFLRKQAQQKFSSLDTSYVLYNGADETIFYPAPDQKKEPGTPIALFAGRIVRDKGVHVLVRCHEAPCTTRRKTSTTASLALPISAIAETRTTSHN